MPLSRSPETHPSLDDFLGQDVYVRELIIDQLASNVVHLKRMAQTNKGFNKHILCNGDTTQSPAKKKAKATAPLAPRVLTLECLHKINPDVLGIVTEHLELHAVNLRQTCKGFKDLALAPGAQLALVGLQTGPSVPLDFHVMRRTTRACTLASWDYFSYRANIKWQMEWALYREAFNRASIDHLIDAFVAIPEGKWKFFGSLYLGHHGKLRARGPDGFGDVNDEDDEDDEDHEDHEEREPSLTSVVKGSNFTSHLRLVLFKAIEERFWDVCVGKDLEKPMHPEDVVPTVKRIFNVVGVDNDRCFHFTTRGWLKYTPFLLAAESHSLELVRYLARRNDTYVAACSAGGNNAYTLCKQAMRRRRATEAEIAKSPVLAFLKNKCSILPRSYVVEGR